MGLELLILKVLLLWHFRVAGSVQPPGLAKPGCRDRCGGVAIPFPFGIGGPGCFLNEWYEITCKGNGTKNPQLKRVDVEVINISMPYGPDIRSRSAGCSGTVEVKLPIVYSNATCARDHSRASRRAPNMHGSPFIYSLRKNIFFAAGSDSLEAVIKNTGPLLVGCKLGCSGRKCSNSVNCSGYGGCCKTGISSLALQEFDVNFFKEDKLTSSGNQDCGYTFLTDTSLLRSKHPDLQGLIRDGYVSGFLDWGSPENSSLGVQLSESCTNCVRGTISVLPDPLYEFYCRPGYSGNPFIVDGCQDIDECEDPDLNSCPDSCENVKGTHHCGQNRTVKFVERGVSEALGSVLLICLAWWLYKTVKRKREIKGKKKFFKRNGGIMLQQQLSSPEGTAGNTKLFNSEELEKASNNFSEDRIVGRGGQGTVYKGMLMDGRIVAIKKSAAVDEGKVDQFVNEVLILSQINHRNVVKLLGCCLETEFPLLVYEFIPNGTLYSYLHEPNEELLVPWDVRLRLATEVAGSLSYLHSAASIPIYHRDIKSTNILLDEKNRAKIADFGTSMSVSMDRTHLTTLVRGTFGYLDPEYFQSSQFTDKSDVYSFGVVLVELLTRQKPISPQRVQEGLLAAHFTKSMEEDQLPDILDPEILQQAKNEEILAVAELARRCLYLNGRKRPTMKEVAVALEEIRKP